MRSSRIGRWGGARRNVHLGAIWLALLLVAGACSSGDPTSASTTGPLASAQSDEPVDVSDVMSPEERAAALDELVDFINTDVVLDSADAEQQIVDYLRRQPAFVDAGLDEAGLAWGMFSDGVLYAHMARRPRTGPDAPSALAPASEQITVSPPPSVVSPLGTPGIGVTYQGVSSGASLPDSNTALLVKGLSGAYPDIPVAVRSGLTEKGYQVTLGGASVDDLMLTGHFDIGVLYLNTHGGPGGLWTTTPQNADNDKKYAGDLAAKRLGVGSAGVGSNPKYDSRACLEDPTDAEVCNTEIEEKHYVIRPKFIETYWPARFAFGSFVVLDACNSAFIVPAVGRATGAAVIASWSDSVTTSGANRILTLFFDRLLGLNEAPPDESPDVRPFDADRVAGYLDNTGNKKDGRAELVVSKAAASLVPSIKAVTIDESKDEMVIEGMFGDEPGIVNFNGNYLEGVDWQRGIIRAPITDTMAGPVYVEQRGRRSNEVPVTEWRGQMSFFGDAGPLGKDLQIEANFDLHLRADIHMFRDLPWEDPVQREVLIAAAGDSTSTWKAFGTSSASGTKITASGSGEMKVEEEGMSHDEALFNVRALLSIVTWDQPPQIDNATLHAHLASEPKARLKFDVPGQNIDSGFPLPLTEALDPLPFEFDDQFDIEEGSTSGSAPGGFGAALSWTTMTVNHAPDLAHPPAG